MKGGFWLAVGLASSACGADAARVSDAAAEVLVPADGQTETSGVPDSLGPSDSAVADAADADDTEVAADTMGGADDARFVDDTGVMDAASSDAEPDISVAPDTGVTPDSSVEVTPDSSVEADSSVEVTPDSSVEITLDSSVVEVAAAAEPPLVMYTLGGARRLLFSNNPEQLVPADLGDAALGDKTIYRVTASGANRSFFEHVNRSGRTLGFGIQAYNAGSASVRVKVAGVGWVVGIDGGAPFAAALAGAGAAEEVTLAPGASRWIFRSDEAVRNGAFFSGVVDFDIAGGELVLNHIAYDDFAGLDGSTGDLGYVQRIEPDGTHEARMYKGVASASEAELGPLDWVIDDSTAAGPLPVRVARYDVELGTFSAPVTASTWMSHIGPAQNLAATLSDMVAFAYGDWNFAVLGASDGEGRAANLGNWGVIYRASLRVENRGGRTRHLVYVMGASPGAGGSIAWRSAGGAWASLRFEKGSEVALAALEVPGGTTRELAVEWVLGGPSGGGLTQFVRLESR